MDANELLIRTMNAAKEAREKGFVNTAESFEKIAESLLEFIETGTVKPREDA